MKKKSTFLLFSILLMCSIPLLFLSSCGEDEPDPDDGKVGFANPGGDSNLYGVWICEIKNEIGEDVTYSFMFTNYGNGAFAKTEGTNVYTCSWEWKADGEKLKLKGFEASTDNLYENELDYRVEGTNLYILYDKEGDLNGKVFEKEIESSDNPLFK